MSDSVFLTILRFNGTMLLPETDFSTLSMVEMTSLLLLGRVPFLAV